MTNATEAAATTTNATAATQGANSTATKATSTRKASQKKAAPKAKGVQKTAKPATKKASKPATKKGKTEASIPREFSKRSVIIEMLHAKGGASLDEIVAKTSWQKHTVRGLLSTLRSKSGLAIERFERDGGGHAYRIRIATK
jgi:hypothetical protein